MGSLWQYIATKWRGVGASPNVCDEKIDVPPSFAYDARADFIIDAYGALLRSDAERGHVSFRVLVQPEASLPASKKEIENAILALGHRLHRLGHLDADAKENLRGSYSSLGFYQSNEDVRQVAQFAYAMENKDNKAILANASQARAAMDRAANECLERSYEFDERLAI